jgi:hypothetical protein
VFLPFSTIRNDEGPLASPDGTDDVVRSWNRTPDYRRNAITERLFLGGKIREVHIPYLYVAASQVRGSDRFFARSKTPIPDAPNAPPEICGSSGPSVRSVRKRERYFAKASAIWR